ncbi:MAG: cbb3-type cytochrome c oxidase subunit II [Acidobacteriota bacterium]
MKVRPDRALRMAYLVASVAGVTFFVMSVALLGVWPGQVIAGATRAMSPPHVLGLSASEERGRIIYSREGCAYCHTQQIRYLKADVVRFGAPTLAWETQLDYPHLWGTRRIGPDLARAGATRSEDWHFAHLFAPRSVVPQSVMPAYRALFDGAPTRPRQSGRDLVAYLETLGRAREIAGPEGEAAARARCECPDDEMAQMAFSAPLLNAHPAKARRVGEAPALPASADRDRGRRLFLDHCATCHGPAGTGDGPGAAALSPRPANLSEHEYSRRRLSAVLWNGVAGTAMSAWRDRTVADLGALAEAVRDLHVPSENPPVPESLVQLGVRVYRENCAQCHGVSGGGDGYAAAELRSAPTNFQWQRPSLSESLRALRNGVDGTQMAGWTERLSNAELVAVAHHVRTFFQGDERSPGGQGQ